MNQTYIVKAGDTLYGISNQYGVSVTELAELNGIKGDNLQIGQVLMIPIKAGTNPNNMFMYTVKAGDTIYGIARVYNTTVQEILNLNYLTSPNLVVGQVIRIPEMYTPSDEMYPPNYINYQVKKGDTLYKIAKEYNVSIDTIIKDNGLQSNTLKVGQILRLRVYNVQSDEVEECFGSDYTPPSNNTTNIIYTVKKGDNLYNIARLYNTSVSDIMKLNNLNNANLSIGQKLKIPSSTSTNQTTYIVKKGDSLYSIAKKFNTTVDNIKSKNNLKSNVLSIGQVLKI